MHGRDPARPRHSPSTALSLLAFLCHLAKGKTLMNRHRETQSSHVPVTAVPEDGGPVRRGASAGGAAGRSRAMQLTGNKVEGAVASCTTSCLGWEEDQGLRSGRKAKDIWGAWEGKSIPWAGVELGRKVYPKGSQSSGSGWRPRWTQTLSSPNPKCVFLSIPSARSGRRKWGRPGVEGEQLDIVLPYRHPARSCPQEPIKL